MKVLLLAVCRRGGMTHYTSQLANFLCDKDIQVEILVANGSDIGNYLNSILVKYVNIPHHTYTPKIMEIIKFIKIVKKVNPNIIHITEKHPWLYLCLALTRVIKKYPMIYTMHDVEMHVGEKDCLWSYTNIKLARISDHIIVHGKKLAEQLKNNIDKPVSIIQHGDYSFFTKWREDPITEEENTILFFGRIVEYKGLEYFIKAMPIILKDIPDAKLIIAGEGKIGYHKELTDYKNNFEIHNTYIPDAQVAVFFQRASIIVMPYIEGSQSGIIPIAYAFKKPAIATDVGGISEVIDEGVTGFIVSSRDSGALADAIIKLLKDEKLRREMGENAYKKMGAELSWDKIAEITIKKYQEILEKKK